MLMMGRVAERADEFDIIHFHIDQFQMPLFRSMASRTVTTLHGRQDSSDLRALYAGFPEMPLVSISNAQRAPIPHANIVATVYHGLPLKLLRPTYHPRGGYLAFLGRISPEKGIEQAVTIARTFGVPLKIAAKVDKVDEAYFREMVAPLLDQPGIEFIGEIDERAKSEFLGEAQALLFPIDWPEPFGLVMIEAMACGTPVLAFRNGSVPEIIEDVTGRIVSSIEEAMLALPEVIALDRRTVRRRFEERFSAARAQARRHLRSVRQFRRHRRARDRRGRRVPLRHPPSVALRVQAQRPAAAAARLKCARRQSRSHRRPHQSGFLY